MSIKKSMYALLFLAVVLVDRVTKYLALNYCDQQNQSVDSLISWCLSLNRGISWGMFHSEGGTQFFIVSAIIIGITCALAMYAAIRYANYQPVFGEILVLAGSCSNLVDRFMYGGVVDFIAISYKGWSFPVFNCADVCIVCGVGLMLFEQWSES